MNSPSSVCSHFKSQLKILLQSSKIPIISLFKWNSFFFNQIRRSCSSDTTAENVVMIWKQKKVKQEYGESKCNLTRQLRNKNMKREKRELCSNWKQRALEEEKHSWRVFLWFPRQLAVALCNYGWILPRAPSFFAKLRVIGRTLNMQEKRKCFMILNENGIITWEKHCYTPFSILRFNCDSEIQYV